MNKYKVDVNVYGPDFPYAVYSKSRWGFKWKHQCSFKTIEDAYAYAQRLLGLPIEVKEEPITIRGGGGAGSTTPATTSVVVDFTKK